jgi:hypothetical protein
VAVCAGAAAAPPSREFSSVMRLKTESRLIHHLHRSLGADL